MNQLISMLESFLNIINALSLLFVILGLATAIIGIAESFRILAYTKFRGSGLPKVSLGLFGAILFLFLAMLSSLMVILEGRKYLGITYLLVFLAVYCSSHTSRVLRKTIYKLLYE